ncbi:HD domain-containing protein [Candidatus Thorarchaeota archaeon]|nr:HD domain-containing protein [Candidatus Thorarchaeota archaeon]TFG99818.1 MAG: HD domain-containing protein [Candidatus Thorarchaeota archaeon]
MFSNERLRQQIQFLREIDDLKQILRQTVVIKDKRQENDAEHSWHLAMLAMVLSEYSNDSTIDLLRILKMVLIHDLVEIYAGDTFCYDDQGREGKTEREREAAHRIFSILPREQIQEYIDLWEEFEAMETPEAQFAAAVDRVQPLILNLYSEGFAWKKHGIKKSQVIERNHHIAKGSTALWEFAQNLIDEAVSRGYIIDE